MIIKNSLGIDASKDKMKCCMSTIDEKQMVKVKSSKTISNNMSGFKGLQAWIEKNHKDKSIPLVICIEATGIYHENCALFLNKMGYNISVVLPNKSKKYLQALGLKSKNDSIDAKGLSRMGAEQNLKPWSPMSEFYYRLRDLTRQHQSLQEQKTALSNQLHALEHSMYKSKFVIKQIKRAITMIDKQLRAVMIEIKTHIDSDSQVASKIKKVCTVKGLGLITVATVVAETNGFYLFENHKQLVSYSGYDVIENQSGKHQGKTKISKRGNSRIRRILHFPAFTAKKYGGEVFSNLYDRTFEKHKIPMKSYVAVQKKLLILIYYLWKKDEEFDPMYNQNIIECEQEISSKVINERIKKSSPICIRATQGKLSVNAHS